MLVQDQEIRQDEEYDEYDGNVVESEPLTQMHGRKFYLVLAWFGLLAVLMVPFSQFHWGFVGLLIGMAISTTILAIIGIILRSIKRKMARMQLTFKQWCLALMGFRPDTLDTDAQVYNEETGTYEQAGQVQSLAQTTALALPGQERTFQEDEEAPDKILEPNGMYLSDDYQPALAPMCGHNALIVGERGFGKSNFIGVVAEEVGPYKCPTLFIDPLDQFSPLAERRFFPHGFVGGHPDLAHVGSEALRNFIPITMKNAFQIGYKIVAFNLQVVFNMQSYLTLDDATVVLCEIIRGLLAWEEAHENEDRLPCIILFDEASMIVPQEPKEGSLTSKPVQDLAYKTFFGLAARGRNYGLSFWVATQRIQMIHKNLLQCSYKFLFHQGQKVDLEQYAVWGLDAIDVLSLQVGECFIFTPMVIGFQCFMRERVSKHQGHTPGLAQLKKYQATHNLAEVHMMTGLQLAGAYHDEYTPGRNSMIEQHADLETAIHNLPVSSGNYDGLVYRDRPAETGHLETGFRETEGLETGRRDREKTGLEINGVPVSPIQFEAYQLFTSGKKRWPAIAVALTAMGKYGRVDNNRSYRIRDELAEMKLIVQIEE